MPANDFSVGRDLSFSINTGRYGPLRISGVTDYSAKADTSDLNHKGLDGLRISAVIPDGWTITIKLDRQDPTVDQYFAQLESDYFAGVNIQGGIINETIQEKDGSISQYRYENVVLKTDGTGDYKGDSFVPITITAMASRRKRVS